MGGEVVAGADAHGDEAVRQARPLLAGGQGWDPQPGGGQPDEPADAVVRRQPGAGEADEDGGDADDLEGGVHEQLRGDVWAGVLAAEDWDGGGRRGGAVAARRGMARSVRLLVAPDPCGGSEGEDGDRGGRPHHGAEAVQETGGGGVSSRLGGAVAGKLTPA